MHILNVRYLLTNLVRRTQHDVVMAKSTEQPLDDLGSASPGCFVICMMVMVMMMMMMSKNH